MKKGLKSYKFIKAFQEVYIIEKKAIFGRKIQKNDSFNNVITLTKHLTGYFPKMCHDNQIYSNKLNTSSLS